jgi:hypothetical protein
LQDRLLLVGRERLPLVFVDHREERVDVVVGQDDVLGDFVELGVLVGGQGVVLTVDSSGLQAQIDFGKGQGGSDWPQGLHP